jgi:hypothetical protein
MDEKQSPVSPHNRYARLRIAVASADVDVGRPANVVLRTGADCLMRIDRVAIKALRGGIK